MARWMVTHFDEARHRHRLVVLAVSAMAAIEVAELVFGLALSARAIKLRKGDAP